MSFRLTTSRLIAVTCWLFFSPLELSSKELSLPLVSVYSDMCYHEEGGDVLGDRVVLYSNTEKYYVLLQSAEGVPERPEVGDGKIRNNTLSFSIKEPDGVDLKFVGNVTSKYIKGKFLNGRTNRSGKEEFYLKRRLSEDEKLPSC